MSIDWRSIADRIRGLICIESTSEIAAVAARLSVPEQALRTSVDARAPFPTPSVISALVRVYGLDPSWVLTGEYDSASHRVALESDRAELDALVRRMITELMGAGPIRDAARREEMRAEG